MNRQYFTLTKLIAALGFISMTMSSPTTITAPPVSENFISHDKDDLKEFFGHCLHKKDVAKCLKNRVIDVIDDIIHSDNPMSVNMFNVNMSLNKNPEFKEIENTADTSRSFEEVISQKIKNLLESRVIQMKMSDDATESHESPSNLEEARKKKGGGKHGHMMMSGMALMAFLAQLFLSKIAFMSGAALLLAKIALIFSALASLKKSSGGGGGDHVVYAADTSKQGWQRSIHAMSPSASQQPSADELAYRSSMAAYDGV